MSETENMFSPTSWAPWWSSPAGLCPSSSQNWAEGKIRDSFSRKIKITIVANELENSFEGYILHNYTFFCFCTVSIQFRVERANAELPSLSEN